MTRWTRGCLAAFFIFSQRILMMQISSVWNQPANLQYNLWSRKYVDARGCLLLQEGRLLLQEIAQITVSKVSSEMKIPLQSVLFFSFTFSSLEKRIIAIASHCLVSKCQYSQDENSNKEMFVANVTEHLKSDYDQLNKL